MVLQEKRILCTTEEPDRNHLWLKPRLTEDGFDLLYFGANGWTPLINYTKDSVSTESSDNIYNCKGNK